jgi:translation initiation factor IF-2
MPPQAEKKKKIYQLAKELNVSHDTLLEYLRKKGLEVKSHMSAVDDEMDRIIQVHFKKERETAEKHQRKIRGLREAKKTADIEKEKPAKVAAPKREAVVRKAKEVVEAPHPQPVQEAVVPQETETLSAKEVEVVEEKKEPQAAPIVVEAQAETPSPPPALPQPEVIRAKAPKMGLTIKGKIDLDKGKKAAAGAAAPGVSETEEHPKKKKKRKRVVEKAPAVVEDADELLLKKKKKRKVRHLEVNQEQVDEAIKRTLHEMEETGVAQRAAVKRKKRKERLEEEKRMLEQMARDERKIRATEFVSVNELANLMGVSVSDVIKKCIELGLMVSINQRLDRDTITLVADEFGFEIKFLEEFEEELLEAAEDDPDELKARPPVVTIMGHVDHGKTSLLDHVRRSNVVAGEAGGITQHIGAYEVTLESNKQITFLDTPGHEAFTAMRARGAQLTDIVVLVVAADDSVMPQTIEAISHAQAAGVPIVIAINKIDKADANPDRIKQQLSERNVLIEEWGGKYQCVSISARTGQNVDQLLEKILLEAELLDMKANPNRPAMGVVIEAQLDKGKGVIATALVQKGTLRIGDPIVAGTCSGHVRAMFDERRRRVEAAKPSTPVQVVGFDGIPQAGDSFFVADSDRQAREISLRRQQLKREQDFREVHLVSLDNISEQIQEGQVKELNVIVKGDVDGSVGALADSLMKIATSEVRVRVIHKAVGGISESDVLLATASRAIIIGFHVRPNLEARRLAERENVDIRLYNIIYDAINDVKKALEGLLAPEEKEEIVATVEIREVFKIPKVGAVAGSYVQDGKIGRNNRVRLTRDGIEVFDGRIAALKRFKDDVREVEQGFECGISLENFNDIKVGDVIEAYRVIELKRKLAES